MEPTRGRVSHSERRPLSSPTIQHFTVVVISGASRCCLLTQRLGGETMGNNGKAQQVTGGKKKTLKSFQASAPRRRFKRVPAARCCSCASGEKLTRGLKTVASLFIK